MTAKLVRSQYWSDARIQRYQADKLSFILEHALRKIPHYRCLAGAGDPSDPKSLLRQFPILEKSHVQDDAKRLVDPALATASLHQSRTSGSTGEPTTTYFDDYSWLLSKYALKARRVLNAGRPFGQRLLVANEQSDRAHETLSHVSLAKYLLETANITVEDPVEVNVRKLLDFQPTMIYGYPSYLGHLGESMQHATAHPARVPIVFTSSEILTPTEREHLQRIYSGRVIDVYGSTEFKEIAVQCEFGTYHVNFESVYVEPHPDPQAEHPRVLITTLVNKAMPLIRYDLGDHAEFGRGRCRCGRNGPHLLQPHGRSAEMLLFPGDVAVTPFVLTTIVGSFPEIKNYTIVHASPDSLRVRVFAQPRLSDERRSELVNRIRSKVPASVRISVEPLDDRLPTGKRVCVIRTF